MNACRPSYIPDQYLPIVSSINPTNVSLYTQVYSVYYEPKYKPNNVCQQIPVYDRSILPYAKSKPKLSTYKLKYRPDICLSIDSTINPINVCLQTQV